MKIAARFPIKKSPYVLAVVIIIHGLLFVWSFIGWGINWQKLLLLFSLLLSCFYCFKHYQRITQSDDDLCWSGENWLMQALRTELKTSSSNKQIVYLRLENTSWVSRQLSLLHFSDGDNHYCWLFSRSQLGKKLYSQLVYLVKQNLR